ncbi:MAG: NAD-dependent DNA ligase LigA [Phycisphaerae bacterium]|nr:NAD-dependent DNA ligase LigA [Phycisphaerae bacterium]
MSPEESIANLTTLLNRANYDYYVDASPTLSDREYDQLLLELTQLEVEHPELANENSPTQRVGGEPIDAFHSVQHNVPMQSIDNTYTLEDVELWYSKLPSSSICICDPKIDGVAISLRYEQGALVSAITRGDGESGDDVTVQAKTIRSIPLTLRGDPPEILEVRGEIFMPNASFEEINLQRETEGVQLFANARNATAGTLKSLDPKKVAKRKLAFLAHGKGEVVWEGMPSSWSEFVQGLRDLGIPSSDKATICNTPSEITKAVVSFGDVKDSLGYGVDGMVVRVNDFASQVELGATSKSPRWCIAYKYPAEQGVTKLLSVDWQVGKNGTLTPRATMEPIQLAGTTVQHATLHNIDEIHRKDIRIFDSVVVEKAGEIIPQVVGFKEDARDGSQIIIEPPKGCPKCDGPVEKEGPKLYCVSPECPAQFREKVKWFAARDQMNIDGLGDKVVDQLVDAGLVQHFADLYRLQSADLLPLEGFAEKSAEALIAAIEESKTRGLARVLSGVGIRLVGRATAKTIARNFPDLDSLQQATLEEFVALDDFGKITAETLFKAIHCEKGQTLFRRLQDAGVLLESTKSQNIDPEFDGKTFVITGTFEHWERKKLTDELEKRGAKVSGSVSKNTSIVLAGEKAGSKLKKAVSLGVEVWDEAQLTASLSG